jgi:hypothetical protein
LKKFDSNFFDAKAQYAIKVNIRKLTDGLNLGLDENTINNAIMKLNIFFILKLLI